MEKELGGEVKKPIITEHKKQTLPAIDDQDLRNLNTEKVVNAFDQVGTYAQKLIKDHKYTRIYTIMMICIILFLFIGSYIYLYTKTGENFLDSVFIVEGHVQRYTCFYSGENATFRNPEMANEFRILYPGSECRYRNVGR